MSNLDAPSPTAVRNVLVASIVVTAFHYTDNYLSIAEYPAPDWINREIIYIAWGLLTLIGIAGYLFYRDGRRLAGGIYLAVYSYTGLSSLGHYLYGSMDDFTTRMHVLVWADGLVGLAVGGCALLILRNVRRRPAG